MSRAWTTLVCQNRCCLPFCPRDKGNGACLGDLRVNDYVESTRAAGISYTGWIQQACADNGLKWPLERSPYGSGRFSLRVGRSRQTDEKSGPHKGIEEQWRSASKYLAESKQRWVQGEAQQEDLPAAVQIVNASKNILGYGALDYRSRHRQRSSTACSRNTK